MDVGLNLANGFLNVEVDQIPILEPVEELTLAGWPNVSFSDTGVEPGHKDDAQRTVAALIYWEKHALSDRDMETH